MAHSHRLRIGRYSAPEQVYLITAVCWQRSSIFAEFSSARAVVHALRDVEPSAATLCFVVMPDHLHWLMALQPEADLSATVRLMKVLTTRRIRLHEDDTRPVWQRGFHDRQLRWEDDLAAMARYVVANPVRAGLVRSVREYSFWDAVWL
ncbi:REP-associated tyrosine transposase [Marinobacterium rhizophilum]|uniref:REP-associated tyrosine transposase n=1 Tax=Marinobacterium rhizophilum TaxID=420402 RepID=UPI0003A881E6|nr:transposase [Marinobacterium rhizophilum]